jgi:hypothetical protein
VAGRSTRSLGINQVTAKFTHLVIGNVANELLALVFESESGWETKYFGAAAKDVSIPGLAAEIGEAQTKLERYVNRRGVDAPAGLTVQGLSLWLLLKEDGTAMGQRIDA